MSRDGSLTPADLVGKLEWLVVICDKCGCKGRYSVTKLIERYGANARLTDWLAGMTADCPKRRSVEISGQCPGAVPDLPQVL
jgi:hypothetical protein